MRDDLRADVFLDGHGEVGTALHGGIVSHEEAFAAVRTANPVTMPALGRRRRTAVGRQGEVSRKAVPGSMMASIRSRGSILSRARCRSTARGLPPAVPAPTFPEVSAVRGWRHGVRWPPPCWAKIGLEDGPCRCLIHGEHEVLQASDAIGSRRE